jgi:hypothetical protein
MGPDTAPGCDGGNRNINDAEFFYPPYLFDQNGKFAARPDISSFPTVLRAGTNFNVTVSDNALGISKFSLIRLGSVTHAFNMDQRLVQLNFTLSSSTQTSKTFTVQMPTKQAVVPPGYYMLFALDNKKVPSIGKIISVAQ